MHPFLAHARKHQAHVVALIQELVECESPSNDAVAVNRMVDLLASRLAPLGKVRTYAGGRFARHLRCDLQLPGPRRKQADTLLALGHCDTVWPLGTLSHMPFRRRAGRLWGPGVFDMKAGLALFIHAMHMLRELDCPVSRRVLLQVNSDEEVGSETSRELTEEAARQSTAVLVLEPAAGLNGKAKTARKGVGAYTLKVQGRASHAGLDFEDGASAIVELARQIETISRFTDLNRGITVNPGVVSGGTRSNVVAAEASTEVDIRVARLRDADLLEKKFRKLRPLDRRCTLSIEGGLNRPPLERTRAGQSLFEKARALAATLGVDLEQTAVGGGSDGNFTAALGVPTLDGLGAVGEGAHASNESIITNRIADRAALLALLVSNL